MNESQGQSVLYKYRTFDDGNRNLRIISHAEFWFASAKSFNDPFDTSFSYNFDGLHTELAERWALSSARLYQPSLTETQRKRAAMARLAEIRENPSALDHLYDGFIEKNYNQYGVCSFAGSKENLLLWAHYADKHSGFCVGLSKVLLRELQEAFAKHSVLLDLRKIKYSRERPYPNFFEAMLRTNDTSEVETFMETKSIDWQYEEEERLLLWDKVDAAMSFSHELIKEVIVGCKVSPTNRALIRSLCKQHVPHARVLQAVKSRNSFSLVFEEIN